MAKPKLQVRVHTIDNMTGCESTLDVEAVTWSARGIITGLQEWEERETGEASPRPRVLFWKDVGHDQALLVLEHPAQGSWGIHHAMNIVYLLNPTNWKRDG